MPWTIREDVLCIMRLLRYRCSPILLTDQALGGEDNASSSFDPITCVSGICEAKNLTVDVQDKWKRTPLHYAAIHASTISTLYLLKRGANLGKLLLVFIVKRLLTFVEAKDRDGNTPLALAISHKHTDYSIVLIQKDANLEEYKHTAGKYVQKDTDRKGFVYGKKKVAR